MRGEETADVAVGPDLTAAVCQQIRESVRDAVAANRHVRLWLNEVERVDAAGLGLLVGLHRLARENDTTLVCANPSVYLTSTLRRRGLQRVLDLQFTVVEAPEQPGARVSR